MLSARLKGGFTKEIIEIIQSGAPTTFTYYILLYKSQSGWFDSVIYSKTIRRTIKYDVLKKEYKLNEEIIDEPPLSIDKKDNNKNPSPQSNTVTKGNEAGYSNEKTTKDFNEFKIWLSDIESIILLPSKYIISGNKYYVSIKADLKTIKLWFPFNYILFFVSLWDVTTDWEVSSPFTAEQNVSPE